MQREMKPSQFSEWQRDDFRREGQADFSRVDDKPTFCLFAEVFLEGPDPAGHGRTRSSGELYFNRVQLTASGGSAGRGDIRNRRSTANRESVRQSWRRAAGLLLANFGRRGRRAHCNYAVLHISK